MNDGTVVAPDGVEIAYRDYGGRGRGLVLLHGVGANLVTMDQYAERLGTGRRVVSIDIRFCGQSGEADRFRWPDAVADIEAVTGALGLGEFDVVGHSLGGIVAGHYATAHPQARIVNIDGFGTGTASQGNAADADAMIQFRRRAAAGLLAMTAPPAEGDLAWKEVQAQLIRPRFQAFGYTAPNIDQVIERHFVALPDGRYRRHPTRRLIEDTSEETRPRNVLHMFRGNTTPTLIIHCTNSGWPPVLTAELDELAATDPNVRIARLPITHMAPAWDALDQVTDLIIQFLANTAR
ncbi:hypothetical protein DLJ46_19915 [Micromonospora globispora]|uniref:AB hydrolase-1 domain-containing protein n=1 Tax=Micromonospora globispora TaxID=1450148 RepID=A0A317JYY4_9ACTN|nr:alpha/beta hydrolase [Micromonospora globispora]PWU45911.1 hypothetical protein DLJ46_19915 [Micromonospora globispora]